MKKLRQLFVSQKIKDSIKESQSNVQAAKDERQWIENEIVPMLQSQQEYAKEILQRNHFAESLSRTFQRRIPNGGL